MLPYHIYRSSRTDMAGNPVDLGIAERGKTVLTASGKERIQGVQAQLFAETIRDFKWVLQTLPIAQEKELPTSTAYLLEEMRKYSLRLPDALEI